MTPAAPGSASNRASAPGRYDIALDCVHCGLCLPACPTYVQLGDEADSPRGRIYLMRAHDEGRQPLTAGLMEHLDRCLVCRACETVCPSGVQFGALMEDFRATARQKTPPPRGLAARARAATGRAMLVHVVPHRRRLRWAVDALRLYRTSGAQWLVRRLGLARVVGLGEQEAMSPPVAPRAARAAWPERLPAFGAQRARVLFLRGCVTPELLPAMQRASIAALRHNGCEVVTPRHQGCCGALHFHAGLHARGMALLEANLRAFGGADAIVVNAAGCGSTLKEYGRLAATDARLAAAASAVASRIRDATEFLDELGLVAPRQPVPGRVAYDEPCHLLHGQRITAAPRSVLGRIPGLELVPLRDADRCCGSAGIYNVAQPALAGAILDDKIAAIADSRCDVVATGNPGCILQIRSGLRRHAGRVERLGRVQVVHPLQLLAASYGEPIEADA
jgi:glycolate oxidase iron-sulfur subunit